MSVPGTKNEKGNGERKLTFPFSFYPGFASFLIARVSVLVSAIAFLNKAILKTASQAA